MNKKGLSKRLFPILAILMLAPWPVAYAYDIGVTQDEVVRVTAAAPSSGPNMAVFGKAITRVNPGDLFYIDASNDPSDIKVTLSITNTQDLVHNFRYVILKVGVYGKDDSGGWAKASLNDGKPISDTFITLQNGQVSFNLAGNMSYKLAIDDGSLNCITTNTAGGSVSPQFSLEVS